MFTNLKNWFDTGTPYIWLNAGAVSISVLMVIGLIGLIAVRGMGHFWPSQVSLFDYLENDGSTSIIVGELVDEETVPMARVSGGTNADHDGKTVDRYLFKTGNRDITGLDFRWVLKSSIGEQSFPVELMILERREWGNFYGYLQNVKEDNEVVTGKENDWDLFQSYLDSNDIIHDEIRHIEKDLIGKINYEMERLRLQQRGLELKEIKAKAPYDEIKTKRQSLQDDYDVLTKKLEKLYLQFNKASITATTAEGNTVEIPLSKIVRAYRPNAMSQLQRFGFYFIKLWEFMSDDPREANTEGGIFPAIFGTVLMVMLMALIVTPFGVVAAVYLHEYAKQGPLTRLIRIAVNNLAGVPSVVYGVFGLGFFVYFLGGSIDELFYPEALPTPTFGTPGLMWASLTLAILTVPVVIVATEEGLSRVPRALREGSLALGATKAETLWRTVMPMTASAIMTGMILAIARAAGEVAPLMLVGVVKLAPTLPLDANFPYLHMERKFMHLGFHIYDVGFQSPNVEAARPLVYATALLLILIIIVLNLTAIRIRNNLREKYRAAE
ncbi:MAG: phosphate ABC transporter permease PstA [Gammaproteobacteria bacterium]|jgi:phosphate transport system permease protein|nr:phosphate ABC transporter permease PstA [Gammaproteobacteria bacterium]